MMILLRKNVIMISVIYHSGNKVAPDLEPSPNKHILMVKDRSQFSDTFFVSIHTFIHIFLFSSVKDKRSKNSTVEW